MVDPPRVVGQVDAALEQMAAGVVRDLVAAADSIDRELARLLAAWPEKPQPVRVKLLRDLQGHVRTLMLQSRATVHAALPDALSGAYQFGAHSTALTMAAVTSSTQAAGFAAIDRSVLAQLVDDTYRDVLDATRQMEATTKDLARRLVRDHARDKIVTGQTATAAAKLLERDLAGHGISAVTYRNGAEHGLAEYSEMVMRTKTAEAYQVGGFNQGRALGIEWWEILDNPSCGLDGHNDPTRANGLIVTTATAERFPISHPRCVRVTTPRPDITSAEQARSPRQSVVTPSQIADQALVEIRQGRGREPRRPGLGTRVPELAPRGPNGRINLPAGRAASPAAKKAAAKVLRRASPTRALESKSVRTATANVARRVGPADRLANLEQKSLAELDALAADPAVFADPELAARFEAAIDAAEHREALASGITKAHAQRTAAEERAVARFYRETAERDAAARAIARDSLPPARRGDTATQALREQYDDWLHLQVLEAERATRGNIFSKEGWASGVSLEALWSGNAKTAVRFASEELRRWWIEDTSRRMTYTEWRARARPGLRRQGQASRDAFESALMAGDSERLRAAQAAAARRRRG
jgi:hypothetical protein